MTKPAFLRRALALALVVVLGTAMAVPAAAADEDTASAAQTGEVSILLSDDGVTVDGEPASEDPSATVYVGAEIIYYHDLDTYESGNPYGEGTDAEKHTEEEAALHTCVTITQAGTYRISGTLSYGQIAVDLGEDSRTDPTAVVTLILDNANVTCTIAPALIFYNVYECDTAWTAYDNDETDSYEASATQDTSAAGANVILADGSVNNFTGSHVARIYKDNGDQKKLYKYDGAFYSVQSMNIDGEEAGDGVLNIVGDNEGLNSEQHLTINGGKINIQSQDDGINTNEDGISVTTINGGSLHIVAGLGSEGDGIDSNGFLVINGGVVIALANPQSDSGLDSDMGSYINGGYVVATGSTMDWAESDSEQVTMNLQFAGSQDADEAIIVTDTEGNVVFAYDPEEDETTGENYRGYQGAVISCPEFQVGETYYVYVGGDVYGEEVDGLYDASTVTGFSDDAVQQQYTGTDVSFGGPGGGPGGFGRDAEGFGGEAFSDEFLSLMDTVRENSEELLAMAEAADGDWEALIVGNSARLQELFGMTEEELTALAQTYGDQLTQLLDRMGSAPEDMGQPPEMGEMGERPERPETAEGELPEMPEGAMPDMGQRPDMGNDGGAESSGTASVNFYMTDKVNAFSGVSDVTDSSAVSFTDVPADAWYAEDVATAVEQGWMTGITETAFGPSDGFTKGDLAEALYVLSGSPSGYDSALDWAQASSWWAAADGGADTALSRQQLAVALYAFANGEAAEADLSVYTDAGDIAADALEAVQWAVANGILQGFEDGTLSPDSPVSRAQAAVILGRLA